MASPAFTLPGHRLPVHAAGVLMTQRYRDRGDGVIQDLHTSLYWLRQPLRLVTTESKQRRFW